MTDADRTKAPLIKMNSTNTNQNTRFSMGRQRLQSQELEPPRRALPEIPNTPPAIVTPPKPPKPSKPNKPNFQEASTTTNHNSPNNTPNNSNNSPNNTNTQNNTGALHKKKFEPTMNRSSSPKPTSPGSPAIAANSKSTSSPSVASRSLQRSTHPNTAEPSQGGAEKGRTRVSSSQIPNLQTKRTMSTPAVTVRPLGVNQHASRPRPPSVNRGNPLAGLGSPTAGRRDSRSGTLAQPQEPPPQPATPPAITPKPPIPSRMSLTIHKPTEAPKLPPKPVVLTEEEHRSICDALKKFSNANKQLLAVSKSVSYKLQSMKKSKVNFSTLDQSAADLSQFNERFTQFVRDAQKDLDHKQTCKVVCLTVDISNLTSVICAAMKVATAEFSDDSFFKQCLKSITTSRDSLLGVIDELTSVSEKVDPSLVPQLDSQVKTINTVLASLLGSKTSGPLISAGTRMQVEAAVRAIVASIVKLISSFNRPLEQTVITEAKVASCCIAQLWATLNETVNTNTNLLTVPNIKEKISSFAVQIKSLFAEFMEQTKQHVSNPSPTTFTHLRELFEPVRQLLREIIAQFHVFSAIDTATISDPASFVNGAPNEKQYQIADQTVGDPEYVVPPPPATEAESAIDLPDNYVPEPDLIWDEPATEEGRILYGESGALRCATLNKLIIHITSSELASMDSVKTFLTTYRSFTTPEVLLKKLVDRYHVPSDISVDSVRSIQLRCFNSLKQLIMTQYEDLSDNFIKQLEKLDDPNSSHKDFGNMVSSTLQKKQESRLETKNEIINFTIEERIPLSPEKLLFVISEEEIARQLTLVDFKIFQAIKPLELLNQAWSKAKYKYRAKNVLTLIARSTSLTKWVASVILWQDTLRGRVRALVKILNIAMHMRKLNNFNSLMAVLAGINTSAIYRLKFTREALPDSSKQMLQELTDLMDPVSSYGNYRQTLHDIDPPCVPFLGTYLTDITFIEDGNPDYIQGLINYRKRELVYSVIREIQQYQQQSYTYDFVNIAHFLTELPSNDENSLYDLSLLREPRGIATADQLL